MKMKANPFNTIGGTYSNVTVEHSKVTVLLIDKYYNSKISKKLYTWTKIGDLKKLIEKEMGIPNNLQRLFLKNHEIVKNNISLEYYAIESDAEIYVSRMSSENRTDIRIYDTYLCFSKDFDSLLLEIRKGFEIGLTPKLTDDGTSGTYFLQSTNRKNKGVFKPFDEEPYTPFNPRGYIGELYSRGIRNGILSGECASREVATFLLDIEKFHGVPPTTFVELSTRNSNDAYHDSSNSQANGLYSSSFSERRKSGSLQMFVENDGVASDYGRNNFPVEEVHKIAILDIRILNCDRNEENILVKKATVRSANSIKPVVTYKLIPIDHGLSFPDCFDTADYEIVWLDWPQAKEPFTKKELEFIDRINPVEDVKFLSSKLKIRDACLRNFRIAETLLKMGAKAGLNLFEIGKILYKEDDEIPATINKIVKKAEDVSQLVRPSIDRLQPPGINIGKRKGFFKFNQKLSKSDSKGKKITEATTEDEQNSSIGGKNFYNEETKSFCTEDVSGLDLKRCQSIKSNRTRAYSENFSNESPENSFIIPQFPSNDILNSTETKTFQEKTTSDTQSKKSKYENFESILSGPFAKAPVESARGISEDLEGKTVKMAVSLEEKPDETENRKSIKNKESQLEEPKEESETREEENTSVLKRTISLPDLQKKMLSSENSSTNLQRVISKIESDQDAKKLKQKKDKFNKKNQTFEKVEKALDQYFFYYFESFLEQHLILLNSEKKKPKNESRKRYYSNEFNM